MRTCPPFARGFVIPEAYLMRDNGNGKLLMDWRVFTLILLLVAGSLTWALASATARGRYEERIDHNTTAIVQVQEDIEAIRASQQRSKVREARIAAKLGVELD